jgi:hypothetical protein
MPVTATRPLPLTLHHQTRRPSARGMQRWMPHISGIRPRPACGWRKGCRGIIRRAASSWRLPKNFTVRPMNSRPQPRRNNRGRADTAPAAKPDAGGNECPTAPSDICTWLMPGENFSCNAKSITASAVELRTCFDVFRARLISASRNEFGIRVPAIGRDVP